MNSQTVHRLFIGGPWDGEKREVAEHLERYTVIAKVDYESRVLTHEYGVRIDAVVPTYAYRAVRVWVGLRKGVVFALTTLSDDEIEQRVRWYHHKL